MQLTDLLPFLDGSLAVLVLMVVNIHLWRLLNKKDADLMALHQANVSVLEKLNTALEEVIKNDQVSQDAIQELQKEVFKLLTEIKAYFTRS